MPLPLVSTPWVHVVGDSISIQYGPYLAQYLAGSYHYTRKSGEEEALENLDIPQGANGGDSGMVLRYLQLCFNDPEFRPNLLLINCGLHDIKIAPGAEDRQVPLDRYRENLSSIIALAREKKTLLGWVRTTHSVDEVHNTELTGFLRYAEDCDAYDRAAVEMMESAGVPVADLRTFTQTLGAPREIFFDHVHFTPAVREKQGAFLAGWLNAIRDRLG